MKIRSKLIFSYSILISLFIGLVAYISINESMMGEKVDYNTQVYNPSLRELYILRKNVVESMLYSTVWVSQSNMNESKLNLLELHEEIPAKNASLLKYSNLWEDPTANLKFKLALKKFDAIIKQQKRIISELNSFESYNDPITKIEMNGILIDDIIPQTTILVKSITDIGDKLEKIRYEDSMWIKNTSEKLRAGSITLGVLILLTGVFLAIYMIRLIMHPIKETKNIVDSIARGRVRKMNKTNRKDEIGDMVASINNLSETLLMNINFAKEIGKRNFESRFFPVHEDDELGRALINMRDNLKASDAQMQTAQHIANMGSWERNLISDKVKRSLEFLKIIEVHESEINEDFDSFLNFIHPEDKNRILLLVNSAISNHTGYEYECRIITASGKLKYVYVIAKIAKNDKGFPEKLIGTIQDITTRKNVELEMFEKNAILTKTNMELDQFVYSVTHDLRAPLSSMLGVVQIAEEDSTDEFQLEHLSMLKNSIHKLDGFIQDILDYSKNNRTDLKVNEIHFSELLKEISANLKYMNGSHKQVAFNVDVEEKIPFYSDKDRISVIINNLVSNAIRYHNPNIPDPMVSVKIDTSDTETNIIVWDNGIGIGKDKHDKIFDMFYRVSDSSAGSGLGLYIVKETVDKLNGKIEIQSEIGKGTKFSVNIPARTNQNINHDKQRK